MNDFKMNKGGAMICQFFFLISSYSDYTKLQKSGHIFKYQHHYYIINLF